MQMLVVAWDAVTTKTVVNCFWKSKISSESQKAAIAEVNDSFEKLEEEIEDVHSIQPGLVSENMDVASITEIDAQVLAVQPPLSDAEIVVELLEMEDVSNDNDDVIETEDERVYCPDRNKLWQITEARQTFSLFSKDGAIVQSYANHVARIIDQHFSEKSGQTTIRDF